MICSLLINLNFWSALFGLLGSIMIFFFGLPPQVDPEGHTFIICEQEDEGEKNKAKIYKHVSYFGVFLLILSFTFQLISIILSNE